MKWRLQKILLVSVATVAALAGVGYWYVFIAGAPQLDPPVTSTARTGMTFQLTAFNSRAMGESRQYGLILPPGYDQSLNQHYPVIFLLHGGHDDARAWVDKIGIIPVLHDLYQRGKLPPSIVITPDGNDRRGSSPLWDPDYYDGVNGNVGTLIGSELPQLVKSRYRTLKAPQFWAMGGLSSGGWGALNIGLRHLDNFHILFSHIGYFTDDSGPQNSPQVFVSQLPAEQRRHIHIYLDAGLNDLTGNEFLDSTRKFYTTLNQLGIDNVFYAFPGGHGLSGPDMGWNYDHKHAADSLSYVGKQFQTALQQVKQSRK